MPRLLDDNPYHTKERSPEHTAWVSRGKEDASRRQAERRNKTDHDHLCFIVAAEQVGMELTKVKLPSCTEHLSAYQRQFDSKTNPKVGMSFGLVLPSKPHWEQN